MDARGRLPLIKMNGFKSLFPSIKLTEEHFMFVYVQRIVHGGEEKHVEVFLFFRFAT